MIVEEAQGFAGGIWIMWHSYKLTITGISQTSQFIHCEVNLLNGKSFVFTAVYANPSQNIRNILWENLRSLSESISGPWILGRDFNEISYIHEKKGGVVADPVKCAQFAFVLEDCHVADLGCDGSVFTWQGPKWANMSRIYKRLDRIVANVDWRMIFDDARVSSLPRILSDHNPILIKLFEDSRDKVKRHFRFFAAWQEHRNFNEFLTSKWDTEFDIPYMLQRLIPEINSWNHHVFGNIDKRKNSLLKRIANIQSRRERNDSSQLQSAENHCQASECAP
ncbi:uncharacterized protein LOC133308655 [Gastrolobium bilobum]|uniref:uncharacterized protein LOC133308655 n=1 Tax=Gastrolobium bilobum TaxID=150636 RepID=UPI002AAF4745|nr:uncharacterized protein LOC133308655 [Gastrolobium bilobum]